MPLGSKPFSSDASVPSVSELHAAFRKTRSGASFSPWVHDFGTPLHAPQDFDLEARVKAAADAVSLTDDEGDLGNDALPEVAANRNASAPTPDAYVSSAPSLAISLPSALITSPSSAPPAAPASELPHAAMQLIEPHASSAPSPTPQVKPLLCNPGCTAHLDHQQPPQPPKMSKDKFHAKERSKKRRREKRAKGLTQILGGSSNLPPVKSIARKRCVAAFAHPLPASVEGDGHSLPIKTSLSLAMKDLPVAKSAFIAQHRPPHAGDGYPWTAEELMAEGFQLIDWDGIQCRPILDRNDRVFAVLGGQPRDRSWAGINSSMCTLFEAGRTSFTATTQQACHRRGSYTAVNVGISFGGGQQHVGNLAHTQSTQALLDSILQQSAVRRIASFQSSVMRLFAPRLHSHYAATLDALCARHSHLRRNLPRSIFSCMTLNMGPRTKTVPHRDHLNLPHGWCAITALGTFDPKHGGHLILWELRMVIEFPPGSTILIPSAILTHSNTDIALHERRYSLTQYSAGGLFRWVTCGFQSTTSAGITAKHLSAAGQQRWEEALQLLSHWSELLYQ